MLFRSGSYRYAYDPAHRLIGLTTPLGYETVFTYSEGNDIIKEEDSLGRTTFYAYDVLHNLVSATDPEGGVTSYTYDIRSNRTAVTNALGDTFAYAYDRADRLTAVTDPEQKTASVVYDREGNIESITMPGGRTTRYGYDGNYNVKRVMDPKGYEYAYTYDRDDRLTGILDPLGQTVGYTYDRAGRLVASQDKLGRRESYLYDAQGSLLSHTWGEGLTVAYAYDRKGRPVSFTDPMGNTALYGWDVMDNLTSVTDYLGRTTAYTYDLEDNLTSVTGPMGRKETLSYDMASRLASYTTNGGNTVTYDYDKLNSLAEKAYADAAGKESAAQVDYTYDALGRRTAMEDSTGDTLYTYDALGRLTAVTLCRRPGKSADAAFSREPDQCDTVGYLYDGADCLAAVTYPDGTRVSYEYDLNDNLIRVVGRRGEETIYEYDALNRPVAEHRPDGISIYKGYSAEDRVLTLTNRCDACGWVLGHYSYEYDAAGRLTAEHTQEARERDPYGRQPHDLYAPEQTTPGCSHGKDSTLSYRLLTTDRAYTYDGAGKLLEVTETEGTCGTTSWRYTYDAMGNLTLEEKKNPVGKVVESNRYRYNEDNQLTEAILCDGRSSRKVVYTYDEDGNLIGEASPADNSLTTYRYTVEARLEAVYTGTAYNRNLLMAAAYDGDGNRVYQLNYNPEPDEDFSDYYCSYNPCDYNGTGIRLRAAGEVSPAEEALIALVGASGAVTDSRYELMEYINDVNREYAEVLVEQNINGRIDTVYTYGRERLGREMFGQERRTSYYLYDPRGSVSGLTDGEGRLTGTYRYTATGGLSHGGARYENEYTYNGESYNPNVECQYLRARYYSVARGSFLTQDSYLGELWQPLTWNRYNYCVSSWPNYRDPSGHSPYDYTGPGPADMMELWSLLTGEESYQERAQEYRELQMELEHYEGSASAGMFDSLVSHVGHGVIGIANTAISASNTFWKAVHWFNIPAKLYGLEAPETELISTAPFDTYLEKNAARIWDMDVYYAGRCGGDVVIGAVDLAAMVKGLANLPGALEDLLNGIGSLSGGSPQLQLVGGSAQAAADGSGVISGLAGIGWGSIPALLFGDAGEDFLNSFAKIDRDRLLGNEAEAYYKKGLKEIPDDWTEVEAPEELKIKSESFKNFLRGQGHNPKNWKKVVEKWASPDGTIYQRNYWTNGTDYYYHGEGIEEFFPH